MTLTEVALIFYTSPFIIAVLSRAILKEAIGLHRIITIIVGFTGVLIILRPGIIDLNPATFALLTSVFCYSYAAIIARKIGPAEPNINLVLFPTILTVICTLPLLGGLPELLPTVDLIMMAGAGTVGAVAILLVSIAYIKTHPVTISLLAYTDILWAILLGYLVFGDITNDPFTILGGAIIIFSGVYLIYRERKAEKP